MRGGKKRDEVRFLERCQGKDAGMKKKRAEWGNNSTERPSVLCIHPPTSYQHNTTHIPSLRFRRVRSFTLLTARRTFLLRGDCKMFLFIHFAATSLSTRPEESKCE